jgi:hypothetical protein
MKWLLQMMFVLMLSSCAAQEAKQSETAPAQVGLVNHTGNFIYSASVNGASSGNMDAWSAGVAGVCCASIPRIWYPGMKVTVRWDMPEGRRHVIKEKVVEVEKYDEPGSIYIHVFPNDEVRVVVSRVGPINPRHPIRPPAKPSTAERSR